MFVLNGADGGIPVRPRQRAASEEIDEERRLLLYGRDSDAASETCTSSVPQRLDVHNQTHLGDRHVWAASRTRFIPAQLMDAFEACAWPRKAPRPRLPTAAGWRRPRGRRSHGRGAAQGDA